MGSQQVKGAPSFPKSLKLARLRLTSGAACIPLYTLELMSAMTEGQVHCRRSRSYWGPPMDGPRRPPSAFAAA
eukprot:5118101-Pyramimonas_sp.AAC.1